MKIKELMTVDAEVLDPDSTVEQASQAMADADVGSLPVLRKGKVVGILTDRDIVVRVVAEGLPPGETKVEQAMTSDVVSCSEDDDVETAARLMSESRVRRLVVEDDAGEFAGIVALADLAMRTGEGEEVLGEVSRPSEELTQGVYTGGPAHPDHDGGGTSAGALVKDELAAVETYKQVLQTVTAAKAGEALRRIENEHEEAARLLKERLRKLGFDAPRAGAAAAWRPASQKLDGLPDQKASIALLKEGETREIRDYEDALRDEALDEGLKTLIETSLLPRTRAHVPVLDRFLSEGPVA